MKVILYMATTINGMIAKENDDTSFVSDVEWESFRGMIAKIGNIIIGKRTYEIMIDRNEFNEFKELRDIKVIVVTTDDSQKTIASNHLVAKSPKQALEILENQGFNKALVTGGGMLNGSFMEENLIDEIYIDIEPAVFGKGIKLFGEKDFETKLELIGTKELSGNEIQLHYTVLK